MVTARLAELLAPDKMYEINNPKNVYNSVWLE